MGEGVVRQAVDVCRSVHPEKQDTNKSSQIRAPPSSSQPLKIPECIERYAKYLKSRYHKMPLLPQGEWPPTLGSQYSEITMVERERTIPDQESVKESLEASFHGQVDELAKTEKVIESLDEIFTAQPGDSNSSSLKVLIEGVPGAGKTTLVQKTCKDWADGKSLQQFNLVVLVVLRKKEIERAESVEELLPGDDPDLKEEVRSSITNSSGKHLLFIFDGFDELNETQRSSSSIFLKIIQGEHLHNCAAILTSRPYASDALKTDERIHRHVEILGFTEKQIESYIMHNISDQSTASSLVKSLTEQVTISSFSYTPLSCSILLFIFKQEKCKLPSTLTELFYAFISSIVKRHVKKLKLLTRKQEQMLNLNNLPEQLNDQFKALCKLAYDSLVKGKFVFSPQDIEDMYPGGDVEANLLSLMTSATSYSIQCEETHYQFLHMTIQEFLAARWVATQSLYEQGRFLLENWANLKIKLTLIFFAGITKLKGYLFDVLLIDVCYSDLVHLVLKGLSKNPYATFQCDNHEPHLCQKLDCTTSDSLDPFGIELGITPALPVEDPFVFQTAAISLPHPSVLAHVIKSNHNADAAQAFLCLVSIIDETKDPSLVRRIFQASSIQGIYLDFCRLTPMICSVVANFLSKCPYHLLALCFNFCSLTSVSLEKFHRISTTTLNCWNQCTEVQLNYNAPSFSASLSLLPQIKWFQHTKILCLRGLQYPKGLPPESFQLHSLLSLKALSDLTVTVERIPNEHLKDYEVVVMKFFRALKWNNTLLTLTYDQSPPATNCEVFAQLMLVLSINKLSLTLGHAQVITKRAVILPSKTCFKICSNGLISAMKLADVRAITILEAHSQDLFLESCSCQRSGESKLEPRLITPCSECDGTNPAPAVIYCSNCSTSLCKSFSEVIHQFKMFRNHKLIAAKTISQDFCRVADSLISSYLAVLDISECTLTNEVAKHIGAGLAENKSLKQLNIKTLDGAGAVHIFRALEQNSSLQKLRISLAEGIGSSETAVTALSQMLKINKSLVVLDLSGCGVTNVMAQHIASGLVENETLQALNINSDQLKSEGAGYILQCLQQNETLNTLRVFDLDIQITHAPLILSITAGASRKQLLSLLVSLLVHSTSIEKLQMFTGTGVLDLSQCGITDAMVEKIAAGLTENSSLKQLDLSRNEITSVGAAHIFRSLEHNTTLDKLLLSCNSQLAMGDSEMLGSRLQQMLSKNKSLTVLDLSGCGVTDAVAQHIASGLTENKTLRALSVDSVHLTHEGITSIYQSLKQTEAVEILKRYDINLEILYSPFCLVISIEQDTHAAVNILKSLEQDTTVEGLVLHNLLSLEEQNNFSHYLSDCNEAEPVMCGLPTSARINQRSRCYTLPASCNLSARSDDSEALGCAVERMLTVNQTLRILNLQGCDLDGEITGHIVTGLSKNSSLKQLNLKSNRITSVGKAHIFKCLEQNTSLEELDLSSNELLSHYQNYDSEALGCAVEGMLTVNQTSRILKLQDCQVNDVLAGHIATGLTKNSSVKQLNLKSNRITSVAAAHIFRSLAHNSNLEELDLSSNEFFSHYQNYDSEALGCAVERMLKINHTLRALNLQDCYHNDEIAGHIAAGLAKNSSVKQLNLKGNRITSVGAAQIFKSLAHNSNLEELDLSSNELFSHYQNDSQELGCAVEEMLTVNRTLRILKLQDCHLHDVIAGHMYIANGLAKNSSVKQLNLKGNRITSVGAAHIFRSLEHNTSLEELDLSSNELLSHYRTVTKDDSEALGCAVERMLILNHALRILNMRDCNLDIVIAGHIATALEYDSSCTCYTHSSHIKPLTRSMPGVAPNSVLKPLSWSVPGVAPNSVLKPLSWSMPGVAPNSVLKPLPRSMPGVAPNSVLKPLPRSMPGVAPSRVLKPLSRSMPGVAPSRVLKPLSRSIPGVAPSHVLKPLSRSIPGVAPSSVPPLPRSMPGVSPSSVPPPLPRSMPGVSPSSVPPPLPRSMPGVAPSSVPPPLPRSMPGVSPSSVPQPLPRSMPGVAPSSVPPPLPRSMPGVAPSSVPQPLPRSMPGVSPSSVPPPLPRSMPGVAPSSVPQPLPRSMPGVAPSSVLPPLPRSMPGVAPSSVPPPLPRSMPGVAPSSVPQPLPRSMPGVSPSSVPPPLPRSMPGVAPSSVPQPLPRSMPGVAPSSVLPPLPRSMPGVAPSSVPPPLPRSMPGVAPSSVPQPLPRSMPGVAPSSVLPPLPRSMPGVAPSSVPPPLPRSMPGVAPSSVPQPLPRSMPGVAPSSVPQPLPRSMPGVAPSSVPPPLPRTLTSMPPRSKPPITPRSKPPITPRSKLANDT